MKNLTKFLTVFLLALLGANLQPAWATSLPKDSYVYVDISACDNFKKDGAWPKLNYRKSSSSDWAGQTFTSLGENDIWYVKLSHSTDHIQVLRMGNDNGEKQWGASDQIDISNSKNNYIKVTETNWSWTISQQDPVYFCTPSSYKIYFDNSKTKWDTPHFRIGRNTAASGYGMTKVTNTNNLWYYSGTSSWEHYIAYTVADGAGWGGGNTIYQPGSTNPGNPYTINNSTKFIKSQISSAKLIVPSGSSTDETRQGGGTYKYWALSSGDDASDATTSNLNTTQKVQQTLKAADKNSYSSSTLSLGTISISSYQMSSNAATSATSTGNITIASNADNATCSAALTATVTITVSNITFGYTFDGFYDANGNKQTHAESSGIYTYTYPANTATTITSRFSEDAHTVSIAYMSEGKSIGTSSSVSNVGIATSQSVTAPDITGYTFDSWSLVEGVTSSSDLSNQTIEIKATADSKTITANYTKDKTMYTYAFGRVTGMTDAMGTVSSAPSTSPLESGTEITVTASLETGYEVEGWYSDVNGQNKIDGAGTANPYVFQIAGNTTVYVKFQETKYTVNVTKGTGVCSVSPASVSVGQINASGDITATPAIGYELDGWTLGTGITIVGGTISPIKIKATQAGSITAKAKAKTYTISFDQNGGEGGSTNVTATYNAAMPSATMPTKLGYKFLGYYDAETNGTQYYKADGTSAKDWDKDQNNVTLYAHWVKMYFFIEGRFHVANEERTPRGAVWTNTFSNEGWEDNSRTIPMVWNSTANRFEVRTFATPKELSTDLGRQEQKTPWFYIKASESATEMIGAKAYYAATEAEPQLTNANTKVAIGTDPKFFYFNSEDNTQWAILCYDAQGVYFELEDIPPYYFINISVAEGDEDKGTVKPTVLHEINTLAYGTAKAESKDPQLYSFEKWGWKSSDQQTESFDFTNESGVILHDSCQSTWPEIRVNAAGTDLMLIAHFKAREIVTLYFVDSEDWGNNIRMHLWGGFEQGTTWPGIKPNETDLTCNGHKVYSYTFDKGAYEKVKWSNNGNDKSSNFIIDPETPYYNERDGRWYDALSSIAPDKTICSQWRVVFNNSDEYFKLVEGSTSTYECFITNVPEWHQSGDNWVKMKYKGSGDWDWRGFTSISNNQKVESYVSATYTASTNNSDQNQLNLAGIEAGQTQDFVLTFNTNTKQLTIAYPTPKVEIGVKDIKGALITESDIDSEEGFVLNAYPQNVDKDAECTYSFQYQKKNGDDSWTSWKDIYGATAKSNTIMGNQLNGPGVYKFRVTMTIGGQKYTSTESGNVTIYKYYWLALKERQSGDEWVKNIHLWGGTGTGTTWPGVALTEKQTVDGVIVHYYKFKYPTYNQYKYNNGNGEGDNQDQTGDFTLNPDNLKICHHITGGSWNDGAKRNDWSTEEISCPSRLFISNDKNSYEMTKDGSIELNPTITYYGTNKLQYTWTTDNDNIVVASNGASAVVSPKAGATAKQTTLTLSVTDNNGQYAEYKFYITVKDGILIRVWNRYGKEYTSSDYWVPIIHIWADGKNAENHNMVHDKNGWCTYIVPSDWKNIGFYIAKGEEDIGGDGYVKSDKHDHATVSVSGVNESGCWSVSDYKTGEGYHTIDKTEDCQMYFRVKSVMSDGKTAYYSNKVTAAGSQISFYADKVGTLILQRYDEGTKEFENVKTLTLASPLAESYVYTATFTGNDITGMTKYTGDYYIRTDGATGGWDNYKQAGNKFTSFTRNPLFGNEKYNYYWVTTIKDGKNAKAEVGNTINKCLAQTIGDYNCKNGDANVRFGYCPETNYFTRAIIAGSNVEDYLTLYGDNSTYFNGGADNSTLYTDEQLTNKIYDTSPLKFKDLSDWVYEAEVYAAVDVTRPSDTKAVIKSKYGTSTDYLLGYDEKNSRPAYAYTVLGNTSTKNMTFKITVTYDYKMNRLTTAWMPLAGEISDHLEVDAAIMFLNQVDVDDQVQQITVKDENSDISSLNNIVYVMEFDGTADAKRAGETNHWLSLPFDCRISDIYGIEGYVTLDNNKMPTAGVWGIQRYDGAARAENGRMKATDTYWTWMGRDEELNAGEGYVLTFARDATDWPEINGKRTKRLYFQSKHAGFTLNLSKSDATQSVAEHEENASLHRYGHDANWNLIGPLAYNNITINNWTGKNDAPKFLYEFLGKDADYIEGIGKYQLVNPLDEISDGNRFNFVSFHSYMVQFAGTINWAQYTQTQQDNPATAPLLASANEEFTYTQVRLNLSKGNQLMDKTYVCLSATGTTGYDLNDDLSKITESKANQIGSVINNSVYAANTLPLETEMVALYVNAATAGEYTIALNQENPYLEVKFYDAFEQTTTLLDQMPATVTLTKGEYKDRFYLQLTRKNAGTPTNLDGNIGQYNLPTDKTQKLLINGNIYLINAGRVYNATGAELH